MPDANAVGQGIGIGIPTHGPTPPSALPLETDETSIQAATAAARINALLVAKGLQKKVFF